MFRIQRLFRTQDAIVPSFRGLACILAAASLIGAATLAAQSASKPSPKPRVGADGVADFDFNRIVIVNQPAAPAYPADAKARRIQGTVVVAVTMDEKGVPEKAEALSGPEELRPTAIDYAKSWTFAPARVKGKAVKARFKVVMPFRLKPL